MAYIIFLMGSAALERSVATIWVKPRSLDNLVEQNLLLARNYPYFFCYLTEK